MRSKLLFVRDSIKPCEPVIFFEDDLGVHQSAGKYGLIPVDMTNNNDLYDDGFWPVDNHARYLYHSHSEHNMFADDE